MRHGPNWQRSPSHRARTVLVGQAMTMSVTSRNGHVRNQGDVILFVHVVRPFGGDYRMSRDRQGSA